MNGTEFSSGQPADSGSQDLRYEVESLRAMFTFTLLLMVVFTTAVNFFLFHQANMAIGQANESHRQVSNFQTNASVQAIDFWNKLNDYAAKHPDYMPILANYKKVINVNTNVAAKK
jgi:hypothetical protein